MTKTVLLASAAVLALSVGGVASAAGTAPALTSGHSGFAHRLIPPSNLTTLYNQNSNDGGTGVDSQMFESTYAAYDDQGADDFVVPANTKWKVKEVDVTGVFFNGSGPATSENVYFYHDKGGLPGKLVASALNVAGTANGGSFAIKLPTAVKLKGGLSGKTYWVSVQANCNFSKSPACGEWGWEVNSVQHNNLSAWQNPGGGFGTPCTTWGTTESCIGYGPDFMFALKGRG